MGGKGGHLGEQKPLRDHNKLNYLISPILTAHLSSCQLFSVILFEALLSGGQHNKMISKKCQGAEHRHTFQEATGVKRDLA
jgi:hypothetical protein